MRYSRSPQVLLVALLMCSAFRVSLAAQHETVVVRGTVQDSTTRLPAPNVAVLVDGSTLPQTTGSDGSYRLSGIERGAHVLVFLKNGYSPRTFRFEITGRHGEDVDVGRVLLSPGPAPSANIVGTVTDSMIGLPLSSADVLVNGEVAAVTDFAGMFWIPSVRLDWGSNIIEVRRIGYAAMQAELWTATEDAELNVQIGLTALAIRIPEVVVEGERTIYHFGRLREFVRRSRSGLGHYITRQDFEEKQPLMVSDLIGRVPGVMVSPIASGSTIRILRGGGCEPSLFIDGILLNPVRALPLETNIDDLVDQMGYRPQTPIEQGIEQFVDWYRGYYK